MQPFATFFSGFLFAIGLSISGMTMPSKVINFLNIFGSWDMSLMFVMIGAISVYSLVFHLIKPKLDKPIYEAQFRLPTRLKIDAPLVAGSAIFGAGWGLSGFCPGPALASALTLDERVLTFVAMMTIGMYLGKYVQPLIPKTFYRNE
ncbi:MAG: YeeE/YedE family protein [Gammaproteobacteria bacterium]|nr:MAG: YeeE/YedE family protein [Gammaproteobacteria bacterium]